MRILSTFIFLLVMAVTLVSVGCESATTRYEKHLARGQEQLAQGALQEAILSLKSALAARPGDPTVRKVLVECYLERGAQEPARELIGQLQEELPDDPALPLFEARAALLDEDPARALEVLEGFMAVHGETAEALTILGDAHAARQLWSEALQAYDLSLGKEPKGARAWLGKGRVLASVKRLSEAAAAADGAIQADPHLGEAYLLRARVAHAEGDLEQAKRSFTEALEKDRRVEFQARLGLGQVYFATKEFEAAVEQAEVLVKEYGGRAEGYYLRGVARYMLAKYDDAATDLQTCVSKAPNHPGGRYYLALAQYQRQQWEQALGATKVLQAQFPNVRPVEMLLAELLLRTGDHQAAVKQARRVLESAPESALMHRVLGLALIKGGDLEAGAEALEEAQRLAPDERLEFTLGDVYLSLNELNKASAAYEASAAGAHPGSRAANVRLFYTRVRQGDYDGALGLLDNLEQAAPDDPMWKNLRGAALMEKGDVEGAEAIWKQVVATQPQLTAARLNLASLFKGQNRLEEARKEYEEVLVVKPRHSVAHRELAGFDLADGKIQDAVAHLEASIDANPNARVASHLSALRLRLGDLEGAAGAAKQAIQLRPDLVDGWFRSGLAALARGDFDGADASLRKASELAPDSPMVWYHLGGLELQRKNLGLAVAHLRKAATFAPDDPRVVSRMVKAELAAQHLREAEKRANEFLEGHPDTVTAYSLAAEVQEALKRPDEARRILIQSQDRFGEQVGVLLLRAELERRQGNVEQATTLYRRVLEIDPEAVPVLLRKAALEMAEGQLEEAISSYKAILALAPKHPEAINNLAYIYTDLLDRAVEALEVLKGVDSDFLRKIPAMRDTLGWAEFKSGDVSGAVSTLEKVVTELPEEATVRYHYGTALFEAGHREAARRELEAALSMGLIGRDEEAARSLLDKVGGS